jgi:hypothetical protein
MTTQRQTGRPHRLSVVIPPTDDPSLEETLVSVLENRPQGCEVIVALGTPYDDPWNIGEEVTFVDAIGSGIVGCANEGIAAATGDVIHVLAAGWKATDGWTDRALDHFARGDVGAVVPVAVADADRDQPVSAGVRRTPGGRVMPVVPRRRKRGGIAITARPSAPALEAGFWRADVLMADGGFTTVCGEANAAADMSAWLKAAGLEVVAEPDSRVVRGPVPRRSGAFLAGLHAERLFWRSLSCERFIPALVAHAGEVMRHAAARAPLGTLAMLAGRFAALVQFGSCVPRSRQLAALRSQARRQGPAGGGSRTYRIDAPHEAAAPPHAAPARRLKRSA